MTEDILTQAHTAQLTFQIQKEFLLPVLTSLIICLYYFFLQVSGFKQRNTHMRMRFLKDNFYTEHSKFQKQLPGFGYPDFGEGRYSQKLSYKNWFEFSNQIRMHQFAFENITSIIVAVLGAGVFYPTVASVIGGLWICSSLRVCFNLAFQNGKGILFHERTNLGLILVAALLGAFGVGSVMIKQQFIDEVVVQIV